MSQNDKINKLVQQLATEVVMLAPGSEDNVKEVNGILQELSSSIGDISELTDDIKKQVTGITSAARDKIGLMSDDSDTADSLGEVSAAIDSLQGLIDQVCNPVDISSTVESKADNVVDSLAAEQDITPESTEATPDAMIIPEEDLPLVADFASEAMEHIETAESALLDLENDTSNKEAINSIFRGFHTIKGMAGFLNLQDIGSLAHTSENLLDMARNDKIELVGVNMDVVFEALDMLKKMISMLSECVENSQPVPSQTGLSKMLTRLEDCMAGELANSDSEPAKIKDVQPEQVAEDVQPDSIEEAKANESQPEAVEESKSVTASKAAPAKKMNDEKIKVSMERLDSLVNMVGELVIAQSMVSQESSSRLAPEHTLNQQISHQGKIVRELQELAMMMRMVPIQGVFQRMARLVRDLSRKTSKKINFITEGEETELDRIVVDQIADPLIHMIRNSVDHGIESEQQRIEAGKDPVGTVELRAYHQAGNVIIEIVDDGGGLDKDKIIKKAIEKNVITSADDMSEQEILKLIFAPGFSTAEKVTDVSGRGVGMDVVKRNIEALRGKIDINSEKGKGTIFTIKLPLTLAIIDGQLVRVGDQTYILPIVSIDSCLKPNKKHISTIRGQVEMAQVHGELLPIVRLNELFGEKADCLTPEEACLVVVEEDGRRGCIMVDEAMGQQQVVIKSLGEGIGKVKGVAGGAILGNGRVSLILDILGLLEVAWN